MAGRPTKYEKKYGKQVQKLYLLGATDAQIADILGVSRDTFYAWKKKYPELSDTKKAIADAKVAESLYKRAIGYSHKAVKIFNNYGKPLIVPYTERYPPDVTAALKWLYNRQPELWRDKQYMGMEFENLSDDQVTEIYERLVASMSQSNKDKNSQ